MIHWSWTYTLHSRLLISVKWVMSFSTSSMHPTGMVTCEGILCLPSDSEVRRQNTFRVCAAVKDSLCWLLWIFVFLFQCARKDSHSNYGPLASCLSHYVIFYLLTHWTRSCVPRIWNKTYGCTHIAWNYLKVWDVLKEDKFSFPKILYGRIS